MTLTVEKIAEQIGGIVTGDGKIEINGASGLEAAQEGQITFLSNDRYLKKAQTTKASAILLSKEWQNINFDVPTIAVDNIYASLADLLHLFGEAFGDEYTVSPMASISKKANIHENVTIEAFAQIEDNASIGSGSVIMGQTYIGKNVKIGKSCLVYPGAKIYKDTVIGDGCIIHSNAVIGSDGFGFAPLKDGTFKKIPQIGNVIIGDQVEIGANTVIDRATMGSTIIQSGVKLDNLIQIAHNVEVGKNTVIAAQAGIAGSAQIGAHCQIGGQAGIVGHISIADGTLIQAQSGMTKAVKKSGTKWYGSPAIDYNNYLKSFAIYKNLPDLQARINDLEKIIKQLKSTSE